jgi:uncharacterized protein (UPF0548 family)
MRFVRPGDAGAVGSLIESLRDEQVTYDEVGATLEATQPLGYQHDRYTSALGAGEATYERAVRGLQSWETHQVPGVRVVPDHTEIEPGAIVIVTLGFRLLALAAPVVW